MIKQLFEAWELWLSGSSTSSFMLWGLSILWWGRIGKIIQVVGGLTIILDVIGFERLNSFGSNLREAYKPRSAVEIAQQLDTRVAIARKRILVTAFVYGIRESPIFYKNLLNSREIMMIVRAYHWIILFITICWIYFFTYLKHILTHLVNSLFTTFDKLIIDPIAWVLERKKLKLIAQVVSIVFLLVGFHFDLLSS